MSRVASGLTRVVLVVAAIGLPVAACGGSEQQEADDTVCAARGRVAEIVEDLGALPDPGASAEQVQGKLTAIGANLRQITDAEAKLDSAQRREVSEAVEEFRSEATAVTGALLLSERLSAEQSSRELGAALDRLASRYRETLGKIDC